VQFFIKYCSFVLIQKNEKIKASERKASLIAVQKWETYLWDFATADGIRKGDVKKF